MSNPIPMLPIQPECGSPCATCEALAHVNGKLWEELADAREALLAAYDMFTMTQDPKIYPLSHWSRSAALAAAKEKTQ